MNKWQKISLICFLAIAVTSASLIYVLGTTSFSSPFGKPWHLSPSEHEDSLSLDYLNRYRIIDHKPLSQYYFDSSRTNVFILVDAWGVPVQESILSEEFAIFESLPHSFALHQRLANRNKYTERVELRNPPQNNLYLFGGDSLEYNRQKYIKELGFEKTSYCNKCSDSLMLTKIDSILAVDSLKFIAWTTQSSRTGNKDSLRKSLSLIANFANKHPKQQIIMQGTHRPILGSPEIRNAHKSHWVPVVILNKKRE